MTVQKAYFLYAGVRKKKKIYVKKCTKGDWEEIFKRINFLNIQKPVLKLTML